MYPKLSKSEQDSYFQDVDRLKSILKPKGKSAHNVSIGEIRALIRSTNKIRRRMLSENENIEFTMKVFQHQEIFHQEAVSKFLNIFFSHWSIIVSICFFSQNLYIFHCCYLPNYCQLII